MVDASPPPRAPAALPPFVRWLLIVVLPALGFVLASMIAFAALPLHLGPGLVFAAVVLGVAGAVGALAAGLLLGPWLPAAEVGGGTSSDDGVPPAPHPEGLSWVGPAAAVLVGLGAGMAMGVGLMGWTSPGSYYYASSYDGPALPLFTRPALAIVVVTGLGLACMLGHRRHGDAAAQAAQAPFHRVVLRCALRAAVAALGVGVVGLFALWLVEEARSGRGASFLLSALGGAALAGALTAAETVAWRTPPSWRWPTALAFGALVPPVMLVATAFAPALLRSGSAMEAGEDTLEALARATLRRPSEALGVLASVAPPFALLVGARVGFLPYFGRRAPWPLVAQVPLGWLAAALTLALWHLFVDTLRGRELPVVVSFLGLSVPALLVTLRLSEPLEQRLAARWFALTGGAR